MLQSNSKTSFRYDINALRAIAIIGVVFYHFKFKFFTGGFSGVDVFFVISGYLMSRVVINQIDKGSFSFVNYFEKRLFRIVPALLTLIAIVVTICFFIYLPDDFVINLKNAASSILFLSNIYYWRNPASYFNPSVEENLFLHTWSLSVEWQFYLIYPFILLFLNRVFKKKLIFKTMFIALTVILFAVSIVASIYKSNFSFYMLPTRSWEMLFGGIAFFLESNVRNIKWRKIIALVGYFLIFVGFFTFTELFVWPGYFTLVPVIGTFFVIIANYNDFIIVKLKSFQFVGKISYSLYLWHWPIYAIAQYYGFGTGIIASAVYCVLSLIGGYLSYKYIESIQFERKRTIFASIVILCVGVVSLAHFNVNRLLYDDKTIVIAENAQTKQTPFYIQYGSTCFVSSYKSLDEKECMCFANGKKNILLIGDSHLAQLSQSLRENFARDNINFLQATAPGTLPTVKNYYDKKNNLRELMDYIYKDFIPKNASKIDGVIITANWTRQKEVQQDSILYGIKESIAYLKHYNIPAVVIGQTESYSVSYPTIAARNNQYGVDVKFYLIDYGLQLNSYLKSNLKDIYINVLRNDSVPPLSAKNETYMHDRDHVTKYGADLLIERIIKEPIWRNFVNKVNK
ncbi:acyltransferase family protein [Flavobacterium rivuli]|uniref:acyltransferase family protein n=1 Tax=Flavobacterium rivuli TaxID=498301 RepID=UPI00036D382B|nr:acyltransferase family protein [Flavobacterium rivuli]